MCSPSNTHESVRFRFGGMPSLGGNMAAVGSVGGNRVSQGMSHQCYSIPPKKMQMEAKTWSGFSNGLDVSQNGAWRICLKESGVKNGNTSRYNSLRKSKSAKKKHLQDLIFCILIWRGCLIWDRSPSDWRCYFVQPVKGNPCQADCLNSGVYTKKQMRRTRSEFQFQPQLLPCRYERWIRNLMAKIITWVFPFADTLTCSICQDILTVGLGSIPKKLAGCGPASSNIACAAGFNLDILCKFYPKSWG